MIAAASAALLVDVETVRKDVEKLLDTIVAGDDTTGCKDLRCSVSSHRRPWPTA